MAVTEASTRIGNLLFDAFPSDVRTAFLGGGQFRKIKPGEEYVKLGDEVRSTFFATSGALSILAQPDDETIVEASTVGREGAADAFAAVGALRARHRLIGQVEGEMLVVGAKLLLEHVSQPGRAQTLIHSYIQALYCQAAISAACNAKHHISQRAARWLLQSHDGVESDTFGLKQEFLAYMLGVTRPSVSLAAGTLKSAGLIDYTRGTITILDRLGLEDVACSCYEQIRKQYSELVEL
jgi:CRP-like cAMP-binding protein